MPTPTSVTPAPQIANNTPGAAFIAASINQSCIASTSLLGEDGLCVIEHNAERYVLRRTRNNRLILTK